MTIKNLKKISPRACVSERVNYYYSTIFLLCFAAVKKFTFDGKFLRLFFEPFGRSLISVFKVPNYPRHILVVVTMGVSL